VSLNNEEKKKFCPLKADNSELRNLVVPFFKGKKREIGEILGE